MYREKIVKMCIIAGFVVIFLLFLPFFAVDTPHRAAAPVQNPDEPPVEMQQRLAEMEQTIRSLKHAINRFNVTHQVDGFDMTIDEMLVYIPQLTKRKEKLREMRAKLPKERIEEQYGRQSNIIDYAYTNYDLAEVEADYAKATDELTRAQLALDAVNQRETFEFGK